MLDLLCHSDCYGKVTKETMKSFITNPEISVLFQTFKPGVQTSRNRMKLDPTEVQQLENLLERMKTETNRLDATEDTSEEIKFIKLLESTNLKLFWAGKAFEMDEEMFKRVGTNKKTRIIALLCTSEEEFKQKKQMKMNPEAWKASRSALFEKNFPSLFRVLQSSEVLEATPPREESERKKNSNGNRILPFKRKFEDHPRGWKIKAGIMEDLT